MKEYKISQRPIDAFALSCEVFASMNDNPHSNSVARRTHYDEHMHFMKMVEMSPTIDVVTVVRCKDCKHYNSYGYLYNPEDLLYRCRFGIFNNQRQNKDSDYYCSYGELRTDE